jgi:hypothetical protein
MERDLFNPEAEATLQSQRELVLPNAAAFTDAFRKRLATTCYLFTVSTLTENPP